MPPSRATADSSERTKLLDRMRKLYAEGMRKLEGGGDEWGGSEFHSIVYSLRRGAGGGRDDFLFEQLEDGDWVYRCDEMTELFALAAYRQAVGGARKGRTGLHDAFCEAIRARPDIILPLVEKEGLSPKARAAFDRAMDMDEPRCYFPNGYRGEPYTVYVRPDAG